MLGHGAICPRLELSDTLGEMADPTLKDVLHAVEALAKNAATKADLAALKADLAEVRKTAATKADLAELKEDLARLDAKVTKGFAELDEELTRHAAVHREIEKDITMLKRRPPRTAARPARRR